jgi:DNA-binding protein HU-beta
MATSAATKRMTQTEIINQLSEKSGMKKADVKGMFDTLAELAATEVKKNGEFTLPGFGKLVKAHARRVKVATRQPASRLKSRLKRPSSSVSEKR